MVKPLINGFQNFRDNYFSKNFGGKFFSLNDAKTIGAILVTISIRSNHIKLYHKYIKIFFYVHGDYFHIFVANALK